MRILFITPRFPYPPFKGDQSVAYHRLRSLGKDHEITLVTLYEHDEELKGRAELEKYCKEIHCIKHTRMDGILSVAIHGLLSELPFQVLYYRSGSLMRQLKALARESHFDLVHGMMLRMAPYLDLFTAPRLLDLNDSMVLNVSRKVEMLRGVRKLFFNIELSRLRKFEGRVGDFAERCIVVSEIDRDLIGDARITAIPLGVDEPSGPVEPPGPEGPVIAFSGNMDYGPNFEAVKWFISNCWPEIRRRLPGAQFWVVGKYTDPGIARLGETPGCRILGFVPDMMAVLRQAHIAVAPMQTGSGMQFKILEAMACGLPVVTTTLGLGAIQARPGEEVLVADTAAAMVDAQDRLWGDPAFRKQIGNNAAAFVRRRHTWEAIGERVEAIYQDIIGGRMHADGVGGRA